MSIRAVQTSYNPSHATAFVKRQTDNATNNYHYVPRRPMSRLPSRRRLYTASGLDAGASGVQQQVTKPASLLSGGGGMTSSAHHHHHHHHHHQGGGGAAGIASSLMSRPPVQAPQPTTAAAVVQKVSAPKKEEEHSIKQQQEEQQSALDIDIARLVASLLLRRYSGGRRRSPTGHERERAYVKSGLSSVLTCEV